MSHSNWREWRKPDLDPAGVGTGVQQDREGQFGDPPDDQFDTLGAIISAERGRPVLIPIFPVGSFTPQSPCPHKRDIRLGSTVCCMVCHQSGMDHHPAMKETAKGLAALKNWKPPADGDQWSDLDLAEPTVYQPDPDKPETRKERRARERADQS